MKKQQGFAVLETVLILVIVAIVGFTGWYVWHSQRETSQTLVAANKSGQSSALQTKPAAQTSTAGTTADQTAAIKAAVIAYNRTAAAGDTLAVVIEHSNDTYALGTVSSPHGLQGGWFAKKTDGTWQVQSQGDDGHCSELAAVKLTSWDAACAAN